MLNENDGKQYGEVLQVRNQQKREHMRGKADAAEEEDYATFLQQVLLDVMMTAIYCSISWNRKIFMFLSPMPPYGRSQRLASCLQHSTRIGPTDIKFFVIHRESN